MSEEEDPFSKINLEALQGNFRSMTNPIYVPNPEDLELDQLPTLSKMLDKLHFDYMELEGELDVMRQQIIAINCAISAMEKVKLNNDK